MTHHTLPVPAAVHHTHRPAFDRGVRLADLHGLCSAVAKS
jgi:hypothetical protein